MQTSKLIIISVLLKQGVNGGGIIACHAAVHGVTRNWIWLSNWTTYWNPFFSLAPHCFYDTSQSSKLTYESPRIWASSLTTFHTHLFLKDTDTAHVFWFQECMRLLFLRLLHPYVYYSSTRIFSSYFTPLHPGSAGLPLLFVRLSFSEVFWKVLNFHEISVVFFQQHILIAYLHLSSSQFWIDKDSYHCIVSILQCLKYTCP